MNSWINQGMQWLLDHEQPIRLTCFLGVFAVMALWEMRCPCRSLRLQKASRWLNNLALVALNTLLVRLLFPTAAVGVAVTIQVKGWGLLNLFDAPLWLETLLALLLLDAVIYFQHRLFHHIPLLWRLHKVHHADLDYDVTTGARFHPVEILLSMLIKFAAVTVLGAPVVSVLLFEILLNATAMFNHSNVQLPPWLDKRVRWILVTPDMHRVHHSTDRHEANRNFGFNLPWWDRLFGTYQDQPAKGHQNMPIGLSQYQNEADTNKLLGMLTLPLSR